MGRAHPIGGPFEASFQGVFMFLLSAIASFKGAFLGSLLGNLLTSQKGDRSTFDSPGHHRPSSGHHRPVRPGFSQTRSGVRGHQYSHHAYANDDLPHVYRGQTPLTSFYR